jgi:hypothetical protein
VTIRLRLRTRIRFTDLCLQLSGLPSTLYIIIAYSYHRQCHPTLVEHRIVQDHCPLANKFLLAEQILFMALQLGIDASHVRVEVGVRE